MAALAEPETRGGELVVRVVVCVVEGVRVVFAGVFYKGGEAGFAD